MVDSLYSNSDTKQESYGPCGFRVVSEKKIFYMFFPLKAMGAYDPRGGVIFDTRDMVGRIYKEDHYTLIHTKYESSGPCGFRGDFIFFSHEAPPPPGVACMNPRGMVGRIYKEDHYTLLNTKYESSGPCGFRDFFYVFPMTPPEVRFAGL